MLCCVWQRDHMILLKLFPLLLKNNLCARMYGMCTYVLECMYYCVCGICTCMCVCMCAFWCSCVHTCGDKELTCAVFSQLLSSLLFCDKVSAVCGVKQLTRLSGKLRVACSSALVLGLHSLYLATHACAGTSLRECSLQSVFFSSLYNVKHSVF